MNKQASQRTQPYRNPKLLKLAKDAPHCMSCFMQNDGTVVAAHSNQQRDGKGMGIKAHDFRVAYVCYACHKEIDQAELRARAIEIWEHAHRETIAWLFESGHLVVK